MLALSDAGGRVDAAIPGLARAANVTLQECEDALKRLSSPDPYSRTPDNEGRRIVAVDGGWVILNYAKYRERRDPEKRRQQNQEAQQRFRDNNRVSHRKPSVSHEKPESAQAEAEAEAEEEEEPPNPLVGDDGFLRFWKAYPRKKAKDAAARAFKKRKVTESLLAKMLDAIEKQKQTDQWSKNGGEFIPYPATWLNGGSWNDVVDAPTRHSDPGSPGMYYDEEDGAWHPVIVPPSQELLDYMDEMYALRAKQAQEGVKEQGQ